MLDSRLMLMVLDGQLLLLELNAKMLAFLDCDELVKEELDEYEKWLEAGEHSLHFPQK